MKALIVGMGSMGKRRARLLGQLGIDVIGVDSNETRLQDLGGLVKTTYKTIDEALSEKPEVAFVCTSPLSHYAIEKELLLKKIHVFTELNLVNQNYEELVEIAKEQGVVAFPSATWLYRREMQFMTEEIKKKNGRAVYTYHIGQYLPSWHPWESYKDYFIGSKKTNGCREIMAIELPWLVRAFSPIKEISSVARRLTELDIDYPDTYMVQIVHENGSVGSLTVDITSPVPVRTFEAVGEDMQIFWNGRPETLYAYDKISGEKKFISVYDDVAHQDGYASFVIENAYLDEIKKFISVVKGESDSIYNLRDDAEIIEWIDKIEEQAK